MQTKTESKLDLKKDRRLGAAAGASPQLGGARAGPSVFRSFLAMFLVVGGVGMVLVYVKKRQKGGAQAKSVGDSWLSNFMSGSKKSRAQIEVIANHSLGPKQSITIVRIRGQQFVLGVTQDSVQLITQLDADEGEVDVLDDPKIADSIGKMFGSKPQVIPTQAPQARVAPARAAPAPSSAPRANVDLGASFNAMLKNSTGAGAKVARNAYQAQSIDSTPARVPPQNVGIAQNSVRDQIKQRLQGMKSV